MLYDYFDFCFLTTWRENLRRATLGKHIDRNDLASYHLTGTCYVTARDAHFNFKNVTMIYGKLSAGYSQNLVCTISLKDPFCRAAPSERTFFFSGNRADSAESVIILIDDPMKGDFHTPRFLFALGAITFYPPLNCRFWYTPYYLQGCSKQIILNWIH